jgi:hypothetical protein
MFRSFAKKWHQAPPRACEKANNPRAKNSSSEIFCLFFMQLLCWQDDTGIFA